MSTFDPSIILQGRQFDPVGALNFGAEAAFRGNEMEQQNALRQFLAQNGAGVMSGDDAAMAGFARFDPIAAADLMRQRELQARDAQRFEMEQARFAREMAPEEPDEAAFMEGVLRGALVEYQRGDKESLAAWLAQNGIDPAAVPYEMVPTLAAQFGVADPGDFAPVQPEAPPAAFQALQLRAREAGLQPGTPEYQAFMASGGETSDGMVVESTPGGGFRVVTGAGAAGTQTGYEPSDPSLMIANIDAILNDPGLPYATGADSWRSRVPIFPEAYRVGTRMDQLEGQAFLQAFESLKGAGQITEIEGQKATQAIGRLDRAQREEDYRAALMELREILYNAAQRTPGSAITQGGANMPPPPPPVGPSGYTPAGAPQPEVNANGPAFTGAITPEAIRTMTPMQYAEWAALNAGSFSSLPDEVLQAIIERGE